MKAKPTWDFCSVCDINLEWLQSECIKAILLDVDGTLVPEDCIDIPSEIRKWIWKMKDANIALCLISNAKRSRVKKVAKKLGIPFISRAEKPSSLGIRAAIDLLQLCKDSTIMVGDSKDDIIAATCAEIRSIRVDEMDDEWKYNPY